MATKASIFPAIQSKVGSNYSAHRIGVTHDLADRKTYLEGHLKKNVDYWKDWQADSLSDAQDIDSKDRRIFEFHRGF